MLLHICLKRCRRLQRLRLFRVRSEDMPCIVVDLSEGANVRHDSVRAPVWKTWHLTFQERVGVVRKAIERGFAREAAPSWGILLSQPSWRPFSGGGNMDGPRLDLFGGQPEAAESLIFDSATYLRASSTSARPKLAPGATCSKRACHFWRRWCRPLVDIANVWGVRTSMSRRPAAARRGCRTAHLLADGSVVKRPSDA